MQHILALQLKRKPKLQYHQKLIAVKMTATTSTIRETNLQIILSIKVGLREVGKQKVCKRLGFSRQNLEQHLREKNAESANLTVLNKIIDAIGAEKQAKLDRANQTLDKAKKVAA
jgi:hypothetical protein